MSIKTKVLLFVGAISWLALIVEVFCLELADVLFEDMAVLFVITLLFVIGFMVLFVYDYYKGKKDILKIRKEYLECFKPEKPLRYCPSDKELLDSYKKGVIKDKDLEVLKSKKLTNLANSSVKEEKKKESEDEIVME